MEIESEGIGYRIVRMAEFTQLGPYMMARVESVPESIPPKTSEVEALQRNVLTLFQQIVAGSPTLSDELSTVATYPCANPATCPIAAMIMKFCA